MPYMRKADRCVPRLVDSRARVELQQHDTGSTEKARSQNAAAGAANFFGVNFNNQNVIIIAVIY